MSLADEVAELRRRVADMVRRGVVDEVIPGSPVMVRVDIGDVLSPPLPLDSGTVRALHAGQ